MAPAVKPVMVKVRGLVRLTVPLAGAGVPLVQVTETVTRAGLLSEKFLLTTKVPLLRVLVIVQLTAPPLMITTLAHAAWLAV